MVNAATTEIVVCRVCEQRLSRPVELSPEVPRRRRRSTDGFDFHPTMREGRYAVDPEPLATEADGRPVGPLGCVIANPLDAQGLDEHDDPTRSEGCCGHDGTGGPNRLCPCCGAEVATLVDDCWTVVEMRFEPNAVRLVPYYGRART